MQTYKKVLLFLLIITFFGINEGCHKKIIPTTYPTKPGLFPIIIQFKAYRLKRRKIKEKNTANKVERKKNKESEKNKREALKSQERDRKKFIKRQTPEVQERMKKSFEESEKTRRHKTFWEKLMFWKKTNSREKKM